MSTIFGMDARCQKERQGISVAPHGVANSWKRWVYARITREGCILLFIVVFEAQQIFHATHRLVSWPASTPPFLLLLVVARLSVESCVWLFSVCLYCLLRTSPVSTDLRTCHFFYLRWVSCDEIPRNPTYVHSYVPRYVLFIYFVNTEVFDLLLSFLSCLNSVLTYSLKELPPTGVVLSARQLKEFKARYARFSCCINYVLISNSERSELLC